MKIFIDASFLISQNDEYDSNYRKATAISRGLSRADIEIFISENIISESLTVISQKVGKTHAIRVLDEIRSGDFKIIKLSVKK